MQNRGCCHGVGWRGGWHGGRPSQDPTGKKGLDSKAAIAAVRKAGRTGKARSTHLKEVVDEIEARGPGMVKLGWVKAHMVILGNEAANVLAKNAAEGVPPDDHDKWMSGGGHPTNYCRLRGEKGIGGWWDDRIGRVEGAECPK